MKRVSELIKRGGEQLQADDWNSLVQLARQRCFEMGVVLADAPDVHEWMTSARRWDGDATGMKWRVDVLPGFINDEVPTMIYLRANDPRGWVMPDGYPAPKEGEKGYSATTVDRELIEAERPWLLVTVPQPGEHSGNGDWEAVADGNRIDFFRTEEMWRLELFSSWVILTASALRPSFLPLNYPAPSLARYRVCSSKSRPSAAFGTRVGGWIPLARLWLTRDEQDPQTDRVYVEQKEFFSLGSAIVQPGTELIDVLEPLQSDPLLGGPASWAIADLNSSLDSAASVEFWTV